ALFVDQVGGAGVGACRVGRVHPSTGGSAAEAGGDSGGLALQDGDRFVLHPLLGGGVALLVEGPGRLPQVLQDVSEVAQDRHIDPALGGFGLDPVDLVVVAVDQRDPSTRVGGVAAVGFVEEAADDGGGVVGDAGGQPLVRRDRGLGRLLGVGVLAAGEDVGGGAHDRVGVVDGADPGQGVAGAVVALGQRRGQLRGGRGCGFGGGRAQRPGAHGDG